MRAIVAAVWLLAAVTASPVVHASGTVELNADAQDAFFSGVGLLEAGDAAAALAAFDEAASIQPDFRRVYYYRARALLDLGRLDEAAKSLTAYERFDLPEAEAEQALELRDALEAKKDPQDRPVAEPEPTPAPPPAPLDPGAQADAELDAADAALAEGRCDDALAASQRAMRLDPGRSRVFLVKGLALECAGDHVRAREVLIAYLELTRDPAPEARKALARIRKALEPRRSTPPPEVKPAPPKDTILGEDSRIEGVLDRRFDGASRVAGKSTSVAGVGVARHQPMRLVLVEVRTRGEQLALWEKGKLVWARARVDEGREAGWYSHAFNELLQRVAQQSGEPAMMRKEGTPAQALAGIERYEAVWSDDDGDRLRLRLGRCVRRESNAAVQPESAPCLELTGASGSWRPSPRAVGTPEDRNTSLARTPGRRGFDLSVGLGGGTGIGFLVDRTSGAGSLAAEAGADLLIRFSMGAFVGAVSWSPSVGGFAGLVPTGPFFESRIGFYGGLRAGHRQPRFTDIFLGFGVLPQVNALGNPEAAPTLSVRVVETHRRAPTGLLWFSFEPWVMITDVEVRVVPLRFTIGGAIGTKVRLASGGSPDTLWGPLLNTR